MTQSIKAPLCRTLAPASRTTPASVRALAGAPYAEEPGAINPSSHCTRTFEKAWRSRHRYRRDLAGFSTWLLTIARNVAIDHLRARQRYEPLDVAAAVPSPDHTPEQQAVHQSEAQRLAALLATLEPRQRELIAMKYGADMTNRAIAHATGLSESNVGTILHRAVETLRGRW